ncbi:MAG: hypothetical protein NT062_23585, partial [Proteobacteria bacterium]|nr:hypothetical protein [Pseudomonadota bacterium]
MTQRRVGEEPGEIVEMDAMDVGEWESEQLTPPTSDAKLAALVKQSVAASAEAPAIPRTRTGPAVAPVLKVSLPPPALPPPRAALSTLKIPERSPVSSSRPLPSVIAPRPVTSAPPAIAVPPPVTSAPPAITAPRRPVTLAPLPTVIVPPPATAVAVVVPA